jgi:flavodoxin
VRVLLAYFSRAGEMYYFGGRRDLEVGNTEVLAGIIADLINCDVHRIEAADAYPASYDETVQRNVTEQNSDARPRTANPLATVAPAADRVGDERQDGLGGEVVRLGMNSSC